MNRYKTIDAHVAGEAVRLLVEGAPTVKGRSMMDKLSWLRKHGEPLRKALMLEPRGHAGMHGALFTEPVLPKAHAGLLFMNAGGFPTVSGEAVMAAVTIALEQQIIHVDSDELYIDTPAGLLTARPSPAASPSRGISLTGLPGFVQSGALPVRFGNRTVLVDVAFGGELFAIVDSEAAGIPIDGDHAPELIRAASRLKEAVEVTLHGVIFTAPARHGAHLRSATVLEGGVLRRSPGVTGTIALMAVLDAMGIIGEADTFIHEGLMGTALVGRILKRQTTDETAIVIPVIETMVTVTGHHEFVIEENAEFYKI